MKKKEIVPLNLSTRKAQGLNLVDSSIFSILNKLDSKSGFSQTKLLSNWKSIVGENVATLIIPQRLKPNSQTLLLKAVNPAIVTIISHQEKTICDKINTYFGYAAVTKLEFIK